MLCLSKKGERNVEQVWIKSEQFWLFGTKKCKNLREFQFPSSITEFGLKKFTRRNRMSFRKFVHTFFWKFGSHFVFSDLDGTLGKFSVLNFFHLDKLDSIPFYFNSSHPWKDNLWNFEADKCRGFAKYLKIERVELCKIGSISYLENVLKKLCPKYAKNLWVSLFKKVFYEFLNLKKSVTTRLKVLYRVPNLYCGNQVSHWFERCICACISAVIWMTRMLWSSVSSDTWTRVQSGLFNWTVAKKVEYKIIRCCIQKNNNDHSFSLPREYGFFVLGEQQSQ